jgi:gas vesicle protein
MADRDEFGAFLVGFIVGGLTGAVAALLLAPQSGEETRTIIKERAIELRDKASEGIGEAYSQAEVAANEAVRKAEALLAQAKQAAAELQQKGAVVLEEQKAKLTKSTPKGDNTSAEA